MHQVAVVHPVFAVVAFSAAAAAWAIAATP